MCAVDKPVSVAGIILAAGFSRRLGRPKQIVEIGGETLIARAVRVAREAGLSPVFVVVNAEVAPAVALHAPGCAVLVNEDAEEGIASSIRAGIGAALGVAGVQGAVLMTCDQFGTTPEHLRRLYAEAERVTGSGYGSGNPRVPAYFPRARFDDLLALRGDAGARESLRLAHVLEAPELESDVDTEEDVTRARKLLDARGR